MAVLAGGDYSLPIFVPHLKVLLSRVKLKCRKHFGKIFAKVRKSPP
jgi:hypothetical protein